jgi:NAD(P)-dependent dehydrogenase (short-subunit alcohol dehydrogenase family)
MTATANQGAVLLTGASRGLGYHMAVHLAGQGFRVFAAVRSDDATAMLAREADGRITPLRLDVTNSKQVNAAVDHVAAEVGEGGLAGLVNNAGIHESGPVEQSTFDDLDAQLRVNLLGPLMLIKASLALLRQAGGRIINVSSVNAVLPIPFSVAYNAAKAGLEAASDSLRVELQPWGIPVVVVRPGAFDTDVRARSHERWAARRQALSDPERALYAQGFERNGQFIPALDRQAGHPDEVAEMVHRALTEPEPQTKYVVGPGTEDLMAIASLPDRDREQALAQAMSSVVKAASA